jgi:hypothetical protein
MAETKSLDASARYAFRADMIEPAYATAKSAKRRLRALSRTRRSARRK